MENKDNRDTWSAVDPASSEGRAPRSRLLAGDTRSERQLRWALAATGVAVLACGNADVEPKARASFGLTSDTPASSSVGPDYAAELAALDPGLRESVPAEELRRMVDYLKMRIPADAVADTVESRGDVFDCVDVNEQPSVRQLRAQGVSVDVDKTPPTVSQSDPPEDDDPRIGKTTATLEQPCPERTIPIRRIPLSEVAQCGTLEAYLAPPGVNYREHVQAQKGITNYGGEARLNIWNPYVESYGDFSLTQLWVFRGLNTPYLETVEAGSIHRQNQTYARLFIFFTPDNYNSGCWNTDCGFVQTDGSITLDGTWSNYSSSGGAQYDQKLALFKGGPNADWWFVVGTTWVGYWPRSLFDSSGIANNADGIFFGGETWDLKGTYHAATDMGGDGSFPGSGFAHAAYQRNMRYYTYSGGTVYWWKIGTVSLFATRSECYSGIKYSSTGTWEDYMYFGGPGYNYGTGCLY